jgi:DNA-binding transcriptional LysR family regulator
MAGMDQFAAMTTFVRVVDTGSLSAAARSLPSSLTSVSRQLSALERHFGTQLVTRSTRRLALTEQGRILYSRAKAILDEFKQVELALLAGRELPSGRLRVSAPTLIGRLLVAPILAEFLRRYPSVSVDLQLVDRAVDLIEEDIHISLRIGHLPDSQLVTRKLADIRMVVCGAPSYLARRGLPQTPDELKEHDCLVFSDAPGTAVWRFKENATADRKIPIAAKLWINSLDALLLAALDGAGIVRVPFWQARHELDSGGLVRVLAAYEPAPAPLHLLFEPSRLALPKTRAFADFLVAQWQTSDPFGVRRTDLTKE